MTLCITPLRLREARSFVEQHHRHHRRPQGGLYAIAVALKVGTTLSAVLGVAIVGRPVSRVLASDPWTVEVTRVCVLENAPRGACSALYAAAWRAARALGYRRCVTYTLPAESGASLRGAGWRLIGEAGGGSWDRADRPRVDTHPTQTKLRWEREATA